ncbi:MAG: hypothetical protein JO343_00605 [Candidatus Eremiobacteraeota bacterium]|nr:hypothetical protein [Candidatus Eremiobacteraeota bacterium]
MICMIAGMLFVFAPFMRSPASADVPLRRSSVAQRQSVMVIIYADFALIRDVRLLEVQRGENRIAFDDVSAQMSPETAYLADLGTGAPIAVREQDLETAVLSPELMLQRAVGHTVTVIRRVPFTGKETWESALLVSTSGPILKFKDRVETSLPPDSRIVFSSVPLVRLTPDFVVDFDGAAAATHPVALTYLSNGFSWAADYVGRVNKDDDRLDIDAFITLHNDSGLNFDNANISVVAGSIQRAQPGVVRSLGRVTVEATASNVYAVSTNRATRQPVSEFYQYSVPRRTALRTGETKQTLLLFARDVPSKLVYASSADARDFQRQDGDLAEVSVDVSMEFQNDGHGLGVPLPTGVFHLYKNNQAGEPVFIGEAAIPNTPRKEQVSLGLGPSFDIRVRRVQTDYQEIPRPDNRTEYITGYRVTVSNAKTKPVTLQYSEKLGGIWQIQNASASYEKISSDTVLWKIPVPAGGQTVLTFTVDSR